MSFLENPSFPLLIAKGSQGGPVYSTDVVKVGSGARYVNINWDEPDYEFDVATGVRSLDDLYSLTAYFHAVKGQGHGFRFRNWSDWKSCSPTEAISATDQVICSDAETGQTQVQIIKTYSFGALSTVVRILKPESASLLVAKNGAPITTGFSLNSTNGVLTFSPALAQHDIITAGYHFDLPMCFGTDKLPRRFEAYRLGDVQVPVVMYR